MLEIGIFAPFGTDHDRNIAFCQDTDVRHIVLSAAVLAAPEGAGVPDAADLHALVGTYAGEGVALTALIPPRISLDALTDHEAREREIGLVRGIVQAMGQAGVPFLHLYLSSDPVPDDQEARSRLWAGLVDIYRDLCAAAEGAGVRIATHHYHLPDRLVWNCESMTALLDEVGSPANGVIFCQGKSQMAGDGLTDAVRSFGDRIFMVHIRDVVTRVAGEVSEETQKRMAAYGYLEVALGTGEVDMVGTVRELKQIGYSGQLYPEHYPAIAGDKGAGLAWTIGYIRALDQTVAL